MNSKLMKKKLIATVTCFGLCGPIHALADPASGGPGVPAVWGPSQKSFLGTSASNVSRVYFTGYRGILTEVFYPVLDTPNVQDSQFLVGDSGGTWVDEEKRQFYRSTQPDKRAMLWQVETSNDAHNWRITKRIFSDPARDTLIQRVTFEALNGTNVSQFRLYYLHNPSMDLSGAGDTGTTVVAGGIPYLVASQGNRHGALAVSSGWQVEGGATMVSNGFVGVNDGYTDLLGGASDKTMNFTYDAATDGNIAQMGQISFGNITATRYAFDVVLGFGDTQTKAIAAAAGSLQAGTAAIEANYVDEWHAYTGGLNDQGGTADDQYYLAAMTLKTSQDKSNGAMVAGMGAPWGETKGDLKPNGEKADSYYMVWARDLYKFASGLITAGDKASANRAVSYLFDVQMDQSTGRFPQNSWVSGVPFWNGTQMDQQAMPIILAWKLDRTDLWPKIQKTADYIVANGPRTDQERWEENAGYSPSTIAAEIAGLICAAEIARVKGDIAKARTYYAKADEWQRNVDGWTFTTTGFHGNKQYYFRINADFDPNDSDDEITIGNGGGKHNEKWIVDGGFLELVRKGVKRPDAPKILETLPEYDSTIKQTIAGKGDAWFRYNNDGYGESNTGANYPNDNTGRGRLWPIFTAERGMYEIARTGLGSSGLPYLNALKAFSTPEGFIPEQVWNETATPVTGWEVILPPGYVAGTPTKSIAPLNWAMGEYINLLAAISANRVTEMTPVVCMRYNACVIAPASGEGGVTFNANATTLPGQSVYITGDTAALGMWDIGLAVPVNTDTDLYPIWRNTINLPASKTIQYKYIRKNADGSITWESLPGGSNRSFTTPSSGDKIARNDTIVWP